MSPFGWGFMSTAGCDLEGFPSARAAGAEEEMLGLYHSNADAIERFSLDMSCENQDGMAVDIL